ncbi:MAG: hypothetical protein ACQGTM_09090 [bacterium]
MSRQPKWSKYEVALLIDAYLRIINKAGNRIEILQELSNNLRLIAINNDVKMDDTYRNLNGMLWQFGFMEKAFQKTGYGSHMPPILFQQMVGIYKNDRQQFEHILSDAKQMIAPKRASQTIGKAKEVSVDMAEKELAFAAWLDKQSRLKFPVRAVVSIMQQCTKYAVTHNISLKSFWDMDDPNEYYYAANKLLTTHLFRVTHRKAALAFDKSYVYYKEFLLAEQNNKSSLSVPQAIAAEEISQDHATAGNNVHLKSFSEWLLHEKKMAPRSCDAYASNLRSLLAYCKNNELENKSFLTAPNDELSNIVSTVLSDDAFQKYNANQHNRFSAALKKYLEYRLGSDESSAFTTRRQRIGNKSYVTADGKVDFTAGASYTGTKPYRVCICGNELESIKTWADVYVGVSEYLCTAYPDTFKEICNDYANGKVAAIVTEKTNSEVFMRPVSIGSEYVLETNRSTDNIIRNITFLLNRCSVSLEDVEIECLLRDASQPSTSIKTRASQTEIACKFKKEVTSVLTNHYSFGYRIESSIELSRFRKFAAVDEIIFPDGDDELKSEILNAGFLVDGKVYVLEEKALLELSDEIKRLAADGATALFLESIMELSSSYMEENHVVSADVLKEMLSQCKSMFLGKDFNIYIAKNFVSLQGKCTEREAVTRELTRVWGSGPVCTVDELDSKLPYVPIDYIKRCISGNRYFAWVSEGAYLLLDRFIISHEEETAILEYVSESCDSTGFASISDVPLGNIEEENYELTSYAITTAIYNKILWNDFHLNGKILTKEKSNLNVVALVEQYLADKDECTFKDANSKVTELTGGSYRYMAYEALYNSMVRVDKEQYVANRYVKFDVDAIDEVLASVITNRFIAIKEVTTFALFPLCGQPWNHYLLESFCYRYSKKYQLHLVGFNDKNAGIIAERGVTDDYGELLASAAARAPIELTPTAIGKYFFDVGYMAKSKFAWLDSITERAKASREET